MSEWDKVISELSNMVDYPPVFMDGTSMTGREAWNSAIRKFIFSLVNLREKITAKPVGDCHPVLRTERFDVHSHEIKRDNNVGGCCRTVFQAWFHSEDVPKPICVVTVNEGFLDYVEWIHVDEDFRRQGIATEVMRAIEGVVPGITLDGVTFAGEAFCKEYERRFPSKHY